MLGSQFSTPRTVGATSAHFGPSLHLEKYAPKEYTLVCLGDMATPHDRRQVVAYAEWALDQKYGILTIVSIAISLIMGGKFTFGYDGQSICSGLVARALERTDAIFARSPSHIMPADLAKVFNVPPGGQIPTSRAPLKAAPRQKSP